MKPRTAIRVNIVYFMLAALIIPVGLFSDQPLIVACALVMVVSSAIALHSARRLVATEKRRKANDWTR